MGLGSIVIAARAATSATKAARVTGTARSVAAGISASEGLYTRPKTERGSISINAIAQELRGEKDGVKASEKKKLWKGCSSLREKGGSFSCMKFISLCAREKCPQKYIE
jgi:hypothetical protein